MITKEELHQWATEEGLRFDQVERDYVILWVLAGVSRSLTSPSDWVFKGGTCLRHCYYPNYRFSEDIDFTAIQTDHRLSHAVELLQHAVEWVQAESGIRTSVGRSRTVAGEVQIEPALPYSRGATTRKTLASIKVHLTYDEPLLTPPVPHRLTPRYSDLLPFDLMAYSLDEILAEKMRALIQQQDKWPRPRDLYDLWFLTNTGRQPFVQASIRSLFAAKCRNKEIGSDPLQLVSERLRAMNASIWAFQLEALMETVPSFDTVWNAWILQCQHWFPETVSSR